MRRFRLTLSLGVLLPALLSTLPVRSAVDPLSGPLSPTIDPDGPDSSAPPRFAAPTCVADGECTCVSDWVVDTFKANRYLGNAYRVLRTRTLTEFEIALEFNLPTDLCFSIHRKLVSDGGREFEAVWTSGPIQAAGTGSGRFYSSGPFDGQTNPVITLHAGYIYALGVYWDAQENVFAGYKQNIPGDFGDFTFEHYVLLNTTHFAGGCPPQRLSPGGDSSLAIFSRVCLAPEPGACCRVDPATGQPGCVELLETECTGEGSYFHGGGTTCAAAVCEFGACCFACGECKGDYTRQVCEAQDGTLTPGANCNDPAALCQQITGACCQADVCEELCAAECLARPLATYRGNGTTCDPNICFGACCVDVASSAEDGCVDRTQLYCEQVARGVYQGDGTTCSTLSPQQQCVGACCHDRGCTDDPAIIDVRARCTDSPGGIPGAVYLGDGTSCGIGCNVTPVGCCLPDGTCINTTSEFCNKAWVQGDDQIGGNLFMCPATCPVGACCLGDGTCQIITERACSLRGGTGWTDEQAGGTCSPNTCALPIGACCKPDASCSNETEADCESAGGAYQGDGTDCGLITCSPFGACCRSTATCLDRVTLEFCEQILAGIYQDDGSTCATASCPLPGACCTTTGVCQQLFASQCLDLSPPGAFRGEGVGCADAACPPAGACCVLNDVSNVCCNTPAGIDVDAQGRPTGDRDADCDVDLADYALFYTEFLSDPGVDLRSFSLFQNNFTGELPEDGPCQLNACFDITEVACNVKAGLYQGDSTKCDDVGRCDLGACCDMSAGTCIDDLHNADDCAASGGLFVGVDTVCAGGTCDLGMCCLPEGGCEDDLIASQCALLGGEFHAGANCLSNAQKLCPATGACCLGDESCASFTASACVRRLACSDTGAACTSDEDCAAGTCLAGIYVGDGVACDSDPALCERGLCCSHADATCVDDVIGSVCTEPFDEFIQTLHCVSIVCERVGACCRGDGTCDENVDESNCSGRFDRFSPTKTCAEAPCEKMGACCKHAIATCVDDVTESACGGAGDEFVANRDCASPSVGECELWGACCRAGSCSIESEADCAVDGGIHLGPGSSCVPGICSQRIGACCSLSDGTCTDGVLDSDCPATPADDDCGEPVYAFTGGTECVNVACTPKGPCCLPPAFIDVRYATQSECTALGGFYGGDGAVCDVALCAPGGCCLPGAPNESCQTRTVQACEFEGGGFLGAGQDCIYTCSASGVECDIANGDFDCAKACSEGGNGCTSDADCFVGSCDDGTPCAVGLDDCADQSVCTLTESCTPIETCVVEACTRGWCCRATGECDPDLVAVQCAGPLDVFHPGDQCPDAVDLPSVCPRRGACCVNGGCQISTPDACAGSYGGDGTTCEQADRCIPGACCLPDGNCSVQTRQECEFMLGIYQSGQADCAAAECTRGSCCLLDGGCVESTVVSECPAAVGEFRVDDPTCTLECLARGACCRPDGTCTDDTVGSQCTGPLDRYNPASRCADLEATCTARGACCSTSGLCTVQDPATCTQGGGSYTADGTPCAPDDLCVVSACCLTDGTCTARTRYDCEQVGGLYQDNALCADLDCTRGSCCMLDGTCMPHTVEAACPAVDGFRPGDVSCLQACDPRGACCTGPDCSIHTQADCVALGGNYTADAVACTPTPCCPDAGAAGVIWSDPPASVVDARQPTDVDDASVLQGIDTVVVEGPSDANARCWTLCETLSERTGNDIAGVAENAKGDGTSEYTITLARRITPGAVTRVRYDSWSGATHATGAFTSLPGDVGADLVSDTGDLGEMVDCCLNRNCVPPFGLYSCDIDHSGSATGADVLRLIDLLNGAGEFPRAWDGQAPHDDGECPP